MRTQCLKTTLKLQSPNQEKKQELKFIVDVLDSFLDCALFLGFHEATHSFFLLNIAIFAFISGIVKNT